METKEVKLLAFGGGVDSTALLAMHLERDKAAKHLGMSRAKLDELFPPFEAAVFSDPGSEWPETFSVLNFQIQIFLHYWRSWISNNRS